MGVGRIHVFAVFQKAETEWLGSVGFEFEPCNEIEGYNSEVTIVTIVLRRFLSGSRIVYSIQAR
jgi:hypothetical protein